MKIYQLKKKQQLNTSLEEAWDFFSSPRNLKVITPDYLGFKITSDLGNGKMYPGMIITYKVSPLLGIKLNWATEITQVEEHKFFVDEQKVGPYHMWHHQHHFTENDKGVLMEDIVTYTIPWYSLGDIGHSLIVRPKLEEIFDYRFKAAEQLFNESSVEKPEALLI